MKKLIILVALVLLLPSCSTIFCGSKSKITLYNSEVLTPVDITVDGKKVGKKRFPVRVKVKRGFAESTIKVRAQDYKTSIVKVEKKFNPVSIINLTNILGWGIDVATGAITKPTQKIYYVPMEAIYIPEPDPVHVPYKPEYTPAPIPVQNTENIEKTETLSRDNPGETTLERAIIRLYFESEPQGARIFWRIVSSCPDEVKNTNELWLGTTPFEETRSFNILGLTYENSRDVQIEIKVRRNGYYDQTKRFNVRQAIDQQEISSFFDMIPKEE